MAIAALHVRQPHELSLTRFQLQEEPTQIETNQRISVDALTLLRCAHRLYLALMTSPVIDHQIGGHPKQIRSRLPHIRGS